MFYRLKGDKGNTSVVLEAPEEGFHEIKEERTPRDIEWFDSIWESKMVWTDHGLALTVTLASTLAATLAATLAITLTVNLAVAATMCMI